MVKHIILWKLKEEFNNFEIKTQMKEKLEGLMGEIDGLLEINVQIERLDSSNVDVMLYSVFTDEAAALEYLESAPIIEVSGKMRVSLP